jgi:hypothetical protein
MASIVGPGAAEGKAIGAKRLRYPATWTSTASPRRPLSRASHRAFGGFLKSLSRLLLAAVVFPASAHAATIDFTSHAGMEATCASYAGANPRSLSRDPDRVAYAICTSLALAKDVATWFFRDAQQTRFDDPASRGRVRARLEGYLATVGKVRAALEPVRAKQPLLVVAPGTWEVDFDGDGRVSVNERYFFWVPRRGLDVMPMDTAADEGQYRARYASPVVNVDQSDIHWALAYCNFIEAAMNLVLAYDVSGQDFNSIALVGPERIRTVAYRRMLEGMRQSTKLRESLMDEADDDREWIANPLQASTSFPLVMDAGTFATWGALLQEMQRLLQGKTLLGGRVETGGMAGISDLALGLCKPGEGINVRDLFLKPLKRPLDGGELAARCVAPTRAVPFTGLAALASESIRRNAGRRSPEEMSGEWMVLRHLYWVN